MLVFSESPCIWESARKLRQFFANKGDQYVWDKYPTWLKKYDKHYKNLQESRVFQILALASLGQWAVGTGIAAIAYSYRTNNDDGDKDLVQKMAVDLLSTKERVGILEEWKTMQGDKSVDSMMKGWNAKADVIIAAYSFSRGMMERIERDLDSRTGALDHRVHFLEAWKAREEARWLTRRLGTIYKHFVTVWQDFDVFRDGDKNLLNESI